MFPEAIKERISNMITEYSLWMKDKMREEILNYSYYVENDTWLRDRAIIFQS